MIASEPPDRSTVSPGGENPVEKSPRRGAPRMLSLAVWALVIVSGGTFFWTLVQRSTGSAAGSGTKSHGDTGDDRKPRPPAVGTWAHVQWRVKSDLAQYRATMALRESEDVAEFQAAIEQTLDSFGETFEYADAILDPLRDEDGDMPPGYDFYLRALEPLVSRMHDLSRELSFGLPPAYERASVGEPGPGGQRK